MTGKGKPKKLLAGVMLLLAGIPVSGILAAQEVGKGKETSVPRMPFLGKFNAGILNAGIYKKYDVSDEMVWYIRMPDLPRTQKIP